jgi:undecaprenyl diphosphate synthase
MEESKAQNIRKLHIGMILDGNRRYSKIHKIPPEYEHLQGAYNMYRLIDYILSEKKEIGELTIYALSADNLKKRIGTEISEIYKLLEIFLACWNNNKLDLYDVQFRFVGNIEGNVPDHIYKSLKKLETHNKKPSEVLVNIAFCYDGRKEILRAAQLQDEKSESEFTENLYVQNDMDLVIRTGGAKRMSGFFPWQTIYAEWFFEKKFWPEFNKQDLNRILKQYKNRKRRFGR